MPAVQYDYDGYDYIVRKNSTAKKTSVSTPKNSSSKGYAPQGTRASSAQRVTATRATSSRNVTTRTSVTRSTVASKNSTRQTATRTTASTKKAVATKNNSKVEAVRNANRASVRAIMAENGGTTAKRNSTTTTARRKASNKNLEVPSMLKTKAAKPKEMSLKHAEKVIAPKTKAKSVAKKKESVLKTIALSMCAFSMLFLICYRSSAINESFNALSGIKSELETANTLNAQLESDIETQTDLSNIETYAKYQLGMQKPKDSQIKRIVVTKEDKISTPVVIESEETSFLSNLWHDIVNILD